MPEDAKDRRRRLTAMDLTELAVEFGTDKWGVHRYTPHYQRHLEHLRGQEFTLLELGVGGYSRSLGGASLKMWKWFFPQAHVVGLDIEDKTALSGNRITVVQGDQTDEQLLRDLVAEHRPTVVVDDGSHVPAHVRASFGVLFPLLPDDGIYAIEDTQTSYWPEWGGQEDPRARGTSMDLVKDLVDGLNFEEYVVPHEPTYTDRWVRSVHCYHNLVVVEKGDNTEGTNKHDVLKERYS